MLLGAGNDSGAVSIAAIEVAYGGSGDLLHDPAISIRTAEFPAGRRYDDLVMARSGFLPVPSASR